MYPVLFNYYLIINTVIYLTADPFFTQINMNGKQKRVQTMAQLTNKSKDYEKFTRELQFALEKEMIR